MKCFKNIYSIVLIEMKVIKDFGNARIKFFMDKDDMEEYLIDYLVMIVVEIDMDETNRIQRIRPPISWWKFDVTKTDYTTSKEFEEFFIDNFNLNDPYNSIFSICNKLCEMNLVEAFTYI